ncbi:cation:proton antiporter domain-containing protein [Amycolatopsis samaneae]|uniref:Cation:proton antiporter n=1 Tax=Amycolatopsis samaneae TaxID=664691 RepID=A0ABW5GRQ7_9PSEU
MTARQVVVLFLDLAVVLVLARGLGALARRLDQPAVIGEILAGILLGPTLFHGAVTRAVFPPDVRPLLSGLADVGVALFMFLVGLDLDLGALRGRARATITVSVGSMVVPFGLGFLLATSLAGQHAPGHRLGFSLFLGTAMAVTAFPVLARILDDRRMTRTPVGRLALAGAAVCDVLAWSCLALVVTLVGGTGQASWRVVLLAPFAAVLFGLGRPILKKLLGRPGDSARTQLAVVLAGLLVCAAVSEWMTLHFIFGAFLFGLALPRNDGLRRQVTDRVEPVSSVLLLPLYFLVAGLNVDLTRVGTAELTELGWILLVAVGGKLLGTFAAARMHRVGAREAGTLAVLMNTRGLTELVILTVGLDLGVLDQTLYTMMVVMAVVTTVATGPLLRVLYPRRHFLPDVAEPVR